MTAQRIRIVTILLAAVAGCGLSRGQSTTEIRMRNRSFVPEPGVAAELRDILADPGGNDVVYGMVQLSGVPGPAVREDLSRHGVALHQYLGGTSYLAGFSKDADFEACNDCVLWAGLLEPQDKMDAAVWRGEHQDWAVREDGRIAISVRFFDGVPRERALKVLGAYGDTIRHHEGCGSWTIEVSPDAIVPIAEDNAVKWIEDAPGPRSPLQDRP